MHDEGRVRKGERKLREGRRRLMAAMWHRHEIGDGQVAASVVRIGRGRYRRGIGGPHGGRRHRLRLQMRGCRGVVRRQGAKPAVIGARMREQDALRKSECEVRAHLGDPLQRGGARMRYGTCVARGGEIARAETGIIVARPDDSVEVDLAEHQLRGT